VPARVRRWIGGGAGPAVLPWAAADASAFAAAADGCTSAPVDADTGATVSFVVAAADSNGAAAPAAASGRPPRRRVAIASRQIPR